MSIVYDKTNYYIYIYIETIIMSYFVLSLPCNSPCWREIHIDYAKFNWYFK